MTRPRWQHRLEVDRLVQLVDMLVWVVDPQKYADAALHDRYLIPLAQHADVMMIVLNQADRLTPAEREQCLTDLRRLLDAEGLGGVEVLAVSAATGEGMDALRDRLARRIADKQAAARRLAADVAVAAGALAGASGTTKITPLDRAGVSRLTTQIAEAAGVPVVTEAVGQAWRLRGGLATGWPVLAWIAKFKPDPLRRLHLDRLGAGRRRKEIDPARVGAYLAAGDVGVQQARVDTALRALADQAAAGLTRGWSDAVKRAARSAEDALPDRVDRAIATTDLDLAHTGAGGSCPGAAVAAGRHGAGRAGLARLGVRAGLPAAAAAAGGDLVGAPGSDGAGARRRAGRAAGGRSGPDRGRGRRPAAGRPRPPVLRSAIAQVTGELVVAAGPGRAGTLRAGAAGPGARHRLTSPH